MTAPDVVTVALGVVVAVVAALRWLRVAQREHYIAPWTSRLAWLWLTARPINLALAVLALALAVLALWIPWAAVPALALAGVLPLGLGIRGRTSKLVWTARLRRVAIVLAILLIAVGALLWLVAGPAGVPLAVIALPLVTDLALLVLAPIEKAASRRFLDSARKRLMSVRPTIVAITGSYGKTSTKGYIAHVLGARFSVVASPASFNNLLGLSRAVNDRVVPGTEVFVAEMGAYRPGEIRELAQTFPPDIAAITTIGEAHLSRMGTRERILQAKSEITEKARIVVLPIDEPGLAALAEKCAADGKRVVTVSVHPGTAADVVVDAAASTVTIAGQGSAPIVIPGAGHAVNVAVAVGIAVALDLALDTIASRLRDLPTAAHRAEVQHVQEGVVVIDDTFNANPVGAARAIEEAAHLAAERKSAFVVVTPGMIELGSVQRARNAELARSVTAAGGILLAVARTNRAALVAGAKQGGGVAETFPARDAAVVAALQRAGERGVILYENDLPDHYP